MQGVVCSCDTSHIGKPVCMQVEGSKQSPSAGGDQAGPSAGLPHSPQVQPSVAPVSEAVQGQLKLPHLLATPIGACNCGPPAGNVQGQAIPAQQPALAQQGLARLSDAQFSMCRPLVHQLAEAVKKARSGHVLAAEIQVFQVGQHHYSHI